MTNIENENDDSIKQIIVVRSDLKLGKGKLGAQVGHAAVSGYLKVNKSNSLIAKKWIHEGQKKVVTKIENEKELIKLYSIVSEQIPCSLITDAGRTQIAPGTKTCFSIGPWHSDEINKFTAFLKLM